MGRDWESLFQSWAQPPGKTEQEKMDNAETAIRKAINASRVLSQRRIKVFPKGSYKNRTSVRADSDVDICVLCSDAVYFDLPDGYSPQDVGLSGTVSTYTYSQFKSEVEQALADYFGRQSVSRGNKAIDVHANTYRVDADVVACFEYRRYWNRGSYSEGVAFVPDNSQGQIIINWPDQDYTNGVAKNDRTSRRFKAMVRILKRLRNEMQGQNILASNDVASFLIESLVWNVPDEGFGQPTYKADLKYVLAYCYYETVTDDRCMKWVEVNQLKYLFILQPWTREQAHSFLGAAWGYIGF
jgi:hypothetical protein